ncbi:PLP-dependent cysteine synthase family protein [Nocardia sp. NPDC060256]|uniref:PLP-dependent cysteine synthase family protein n=1 Tax=unclassified Nocardia TaxID=2637762 RepID=UPI00365B831B
MPVGRTGLVAAPQVFESVVDAIGHTPLVRLNRVTAVGGAAVYAKLESTNPGGSVKDRIALSMVRAAEASGALRPGGTIVEGTSGNTGIGLALVAAGLGYRTVVVVPDKTSREKIAILRALGAEVRVTPGGRPTHHPEHVRNLAARIAAETPGGWLAGQYDNPANPEAHYRTTGPEIWEQTGGRVTHFVAGIGTGGTVSGTGRFLSEVSEGRVQVVGADPEHSVYGGGDGRAYYVEAVGHFRHPETVEDDWPQSYDPEVVSRIERVGDAEAFAVIARLAREEGLLVGGSAGVSVAAALRVAAELSPDDVVVVIVPDSGRSYLSKYFDEDWVGRLGFDIGAAADETVGAESYSGTVGFVPSTASVAEALEILHDATTLPVVLARPGSTEVVVAEILGAAALSTLTTAPRDDAVTAHLDPPLPVVGVRETRTAAAARLADDPRPALLADNGVITAILDRSMEEGVEWAFSRSA